MWTKQIYWTLFEVLYSSNKNVHVQRYIVFAFSIHVICPLSLDYVVTSAVLATDLG